MSIDLLIGFEEAPQDLESFLWRQGFRFESQRDLSNSGVASTYSFFDNEKSARGVWVTLSSMAEKEEVDYWKRIATGTLITATAIVWTPMGRNGFDLAKQRQVSSAIRERYQARVYDPQVARLLEFQDLECWPSEPDRQEASGLSGSAPPPAVSLDRPCNPTPPQCSPPPIPEEAAPASTQNAEKTERGYNGWSNYETWAVALWLDNEEESYCYWRDQAAHHRLAAEQLTKIQQGVVTFKQAAMGNLAQQLKEEIMDASPPFEPSVYSDLLWAALSEVDWLEIADHWLTE